MPAEPGRIGFILTALLVLGWFAVGTILNIRLGKRLLRWLEHGMPLLGPRTTVRWIGSSGLELNVRETLEPLKSAEVVILLEPRDLPLLWWLFRVRGRRDLLVLRGELRQAPPFELEALDPRAWSTRGLTRALTRDRWQALGVPAGSTLVAYGRGQDRRDEAAELVSLASLPSLRLVRLSVRASPPTLELQWELRAWGGLESRRACEVVDNLARRL